ncbi:hypothetical protein B0H10DRAFT_2218282 [Mycena sp. CBHHK59/15]|nr:hypothetical protein B0H10DRAFT_2218282 [Mycena sp. CBHHK59/15]
MFYVALDCRFYFRLRLISPGIVPQSPSTAHLGLTCVPACTWHGHAADECGPADLPFASPAPPVAARAWPHLRRGHLHPDARPEAEALDDMLDAAAPPEARKASMPLEAHKAITPPRTC